MATLLDALDQENLDNQREVVKNEKRQSYDNRPYGSFYEKLDGGRLPARSIPYHHTPIGSMEDLNAASLDDVIAFFQTWYGPNNAVLTIAGDVDEEPAHRRRGALLRTHPGQPDHPPAARGPPLRRSSARSCARSCQDTVPLERVALRLPLPAVRDDRVRRARGRRADPGRRPRQPAVPQLVREQRIAQDVAAFGLPLVDGASFFGGWVTVRPESDADACERAFLEELAAAGRRAGHRRRAGARAGAHRGERARRARPGGGSRRPASRCTRHCSTTRSWSTSSWPLPGGRPPQHIQNVAATASSAPTTAWC